LSIGLIGAGRWGRNLIRNFVQLGKLSCVCDVHPESLKAINKLFPTVRTTQYYDDLLNDPEIKGIIIAAPASLHEDLAKKALLKGKHVYIEKPLARSEAGAIELLKMAESLNLVLMVGHLLLYHPAVNKLKELIFSGELGNIRFINSDRRNFSAVRNDTNVIWDLAPHDISMIGYLLGTDDAKIIQARGFATEGDGVIDVAHLDLCFNNQVYAHIHNSWIDPQKQCLLTVNGSKKTAVLNDVRQEQKLELYSMADNSQIAVEHPIYEAHEPLRRECEHFLECIESGEKPLSDGFNGYTVVQLLESAENKMKESS